MVHPPNSITEVDFSDLPDRQFHDIDFAFAEQYQVIPMTTQHAGKRTLKLEGDFT
jgi:hypothetical protein